MSDRFDEIRIRDLVFFDRLAAMGSITATAKQLGVPKPTASRWLAALEERLGQTLVHRTTRHVALTERGLAFHHHVREVLAAFEVARAAATSDSPSGTLRVSVPIPLGRLVGGAVIAAFRRELPGVRLEVALENRRADLVREGFDLAIRGGPLPDSNLVARRLGEVSMWLYSSAALLECAEELPPIIAAPGDERLLRKWRTDAPRPSVVVDDRSAVADAVIRGAGVGMLPAFLGEPPRRRGVLARFDPEPLTTLAVHAVFLRPQRDDPRLRALVRVIEKELQETLAAR